MKNLNLLRFAAIFSLFILLFCSCSKEVFHKEQATARKSIAINKNADVIPSITAMISQPELIISMMAFNNDFISEPVFADENGLIQLNDLPNGSYTVRLSVAINEASPRDYHDILFTDVTIFSGVVIDLGNIVFP